MTKPMFSLSIRRSPYAVRHRYSPLLTFPFPSFGKSMPPRGSCESFESGKRNIFDSIFCQLPETLSCRRMTNTLCTCHRNITHTHRGLPSFRLRNSNILNLESSRRHTYTPTTSSLSYRSQGDICFSLLHILRAIWVKGFPHSATATRLCGSRYAFAPFRSVPFRQVWSCPLEESGAV